MKLNKHKLLINQSPRPRENQANMSQIFRRGQIKASITRIQTFIEEFTDSPLNQAKLQQRIENLKAVFSALPNITAELMASDPDGNHDVIENEITENYMDVLATATLLQNNTTETTRDRSVTPAISESSSNQTIDHNLTRMPKRELRKFDGKLEEWKAFSHWFKSNVHERAGISDSTRMSYLQDTLVGEAANTIAGLEVTNDNYKEAWDLLETTYNNEEAIISRHFELLAAIPKIQNSSGESIRQLVNETLVHVRGMKVLGEPTDQWNTPLLYHTISKLDNTTKQEWYRRKISKTKRNFDDLIAFLREEAMKIQTNTQKISSNPIVKPNKSTYNNGNKANQHKSKQVLATIVFKNCPICEEDGHPTYKCEKLLELTVPQRINAARKANLCLNCLRNNHRTNQCHRGNCFKCGKVHHTILHLEKGITKNEEKED